MRFPAPVSGLALTFGLAAAGCTQGDIGGVPEPELPGGTPTTIEVEPVGEGPIAAPPEAAVRERRRMDLEQLQAALAEVTGGEGWSDLGGLAATLGVPDFLETTEEDLSASPMFQKFLDDAAREVCRDLWAREGAASPEARIYLRSVDPAARPSADVAAARADVAHALLRFHGRKVAPGDEAVTPWMNLVTQLDEGGLSPEAIWVTVCVGLITHPHFYTY